MLRRRSGPTFDVEREVRLSLVSGGMWMGRKVVREVLN
jgi:hypothetical protein